MHSYTSAVPGQRGLNSSSEEQEKAVDLSSSASQAMEGGNFQRTGGLENISSHVKYFGHKLQSASQKEVGLLFPFCKSGSWGKREGSVLTELIQQLLAESLSAAYALRCLSEQGPAPATSGMHGTPWVLHGKFPLGNQAGDMRTTAFKLWFVASKYKCWWEIPWISHNLIKNILFMKVTIILYNLYWKYIE